MLNIKIEECNLQGLHNKTRPESLLSTRGRNMSKFFSSSDSNHTLLVHYCNPYD